MKQIRLRIKVVVVYPFAQVDTDLGSQKKIVNRNQEPFILVGSYPQFFCHINS